MSMLDYWRETLSDALEDAGALGGLTGDQIDAVAAAMMRAAEDVGSASGNAAAPNPLRSEVALLERALATKERDLEEQRMRHNKAMRDRCAQESYLHAELDERSRRSGHEL